MKLHQAAMNARCLEIASVRELAALVPMPRLLEALSFAVNARTRRCACRLHGGSNPTAFSWRRWHCFACNAGGGRIALVRAIRQCSFDEAFQFLAKLSGVEPLARERRRTYLRVNLRTWARTNRAAWHVRDEIVRLRSYYMAALHRCNRLWARIGDQLRAGNEAECGAAWTALERLAPAATFFLAGYQFVSNSTPAALTGFALLSATARRQRIFGEDLDA